MSVYEDELSTTVRMEEEDNGATRANWERALEMVYGPRTEREVTLMAGPDVDSGPERAAWRINRVFELFYDDEAEAGEPGTALQDCLTDLIHEAIRRGLDWDNLIDKAVWMANDERKDWEQ